MARLQVKIHDEGGSLLNVVTQEALAQLSMTVSENEVGELIVTMPQNFVEWDQVKKPDQILTVERDVGGGFYPECGNGAERGFFLRDVEYSVDERNNEYVTLYAYDGNYLLDSRTVAYVAEGSYTKRTDNADDMCVLIVRENLGTACTDTERTLAGFTVEATQGDGPTLTKSYARANVLSTLKGIANEAWDAGTYLVFDTVYVPPGAYEFRVYLGQRGRNMGSAGAEKRVVYPKPARLRWARSGERNYIYAGGQGKEGARTVKTATNESWVKASRWNRREAFASANNTKDDNSILAAAKNLLRQSRPRWVIDGTVQDIEGQRYGIDYQWGDIVIAQYRDILLDCHVSTVNIEFDGATGKETVNVALRSENDF